MEVGMNAERVTELRVHGVSGTPPDKVLKDPHPVAFSGDSAGAFYSPGEPSGPHKLEAYSWAGFSSGASSRALWVALLPFALVNLAGWMRPPRADEPGELEGRSCAERIVRLLSLAQTGAFVLLMASVFLDILAFQCSAQPECLDGKWWLKFYDSSFMQAHPGRRLAVGSMLPALLLVLMYRSLRKSWQNYESFPMFADPSEETKIAKTEDSSLAPRLQDRQFWNGERIVRRLQSLHFGVALLVLSAGVSLSMLEIRRDAGLDGTAWIILLVVIGVLLAVFAVLVAVNRVHTRTDHSAWAECIIGWLWIAAAGALATAAVGATFDETVTDAAAAKLPGFGAGVLAVLLTQLGLLVFLALQLLGRRLRGLKRGAAFGGFGPFISAALGVLLLDSVWGGVVFAVADFLGDVRVTGRDADLLVAPGVDPSAVSVMVAASYLRAAVVFVLMLLAAVLATLLWWIFMIRPRGRALRAEVAEKYGVPESATGPVRGRVNKLALRWALNERIFSLEGIVGLLMTGGVVFLVVVGAQTLVESDLSVRLVQNLSGFKALALSDFPSSLEAVAAWTVSLLPVGVYLVTRAAARDVRYRKTVGVAWDVLTFWPRIYHPFAPPCYGERVIPQLFWHVRSRTGKDGAEGRVLLSGHSQGSVISAALLLQFHGSNVAPGCAFMSYGSVLARVYRRMFPRYWGDAGLLRVREVTAAGWTCGAPARWQNFERWSDPARGEILPKDTAADHANIVLTDPAALVPTVGEPPPPTRGHSGYLDDDKLLAFRDELVAALAAELDSA